MKTYGVRVRSRAELEKYLREYPLQLRAARESRPVLPGHPDFIGPVSPDALARRGAINYGEDGGTFFTIQKEPWERARDEKILRFLGEL